MPSKLFTAKFSAVKLLSVLSKKKKKNNRFLLKFVIEYVCLLDGV